MANHIQVFGGIIFTSTTFIFPKLRIENSVRMFGLFWDSVLGAYLGRLVFWY